MLSGGEAVAAATEKEVSNWLYLFLFSFFKHTHKPLVKVTLFILEM